MKSVLSVPLVGGGKTLASCALVSTRAERIWPEELVQRFRFISEVFANALAQKQTDEALREAERRYHTVADFTYDWEYWLGPDEKMLYVSPSAERITGYPATEFMKRPALRWELVMPEDRESWKEHFLNEYKDPKLHGAQFRICRRDGETRWIDHVCRPVIGEHGETLGVRASNRDITALKQAEAEAFHARKELLRTDRLLRMGELTASLAHELNQPLTSILSNARAALRFIQSGNLDMGEFKEMLEDIAQDDKRASDIIRSLRSMVRPEEGERSRVSMNDVLREAVSLFHSESIIRNIRVEMNLAEEPLPVMVDKVLILQVLVNLLMNAAESMGLGVSGDREIVLATWATDDEAVRVAVRDVGPGIEAEELSKIFDPFFTTKRSGLGMGLSLSRSIIEAHGGRIWAENNKGRGVTFYFELPAARP
jgi:PAS domain S-box-containing protein